MKNRTDAISEFAHHIFKKLVLERYLENLASNEDKDKTELKQWLLTLNDFPPGIFKIILEYQISKYERLIHFPINWLDLQLNSSNPPTSDIALDFQQIQNKFSEYVTITFFDQAAQAGTKSNTELLTIKTLICVQACHVLAVEKALQIFHDQSTDSILFEKGKKIIKQFSASAKRTPAYPLHLYTHYFQEKFDSSSIMSLSPLITLGGEKIAAALLEEFKTIPESKNFRMDHIVQTPFLQVLKKYAGELPAPPILPDFTPYTYPTISLDTGDLKGLAAQNIEDLKKIIPALSDQIENFPTLPLEDRLKLLNSLIMYDYPALLIHLYDTHSVFFKERMGIALPGTPPPSPTLKAERLRLVIMNIQIRAGSIPIAIRLSAGESLNPPNFKKYPFDAKFVVKLWKSITLTSSLAQIYQQFFKNLSNYSPTTRQKIFQFILEEFILRYAHSLGESSIEQSSENFQKNSDFLISLIDSYSKPAILLKELLIKKIFQDIFDKLSQQLSYLNLKTITSQQDTIQQALEEVEQKQALPFSFYQKHYILFVDSLSKAFLTQNSLGPDKRDFPKAYKQAILDITSQYRDDIKEEKRPREVSVPETSLGDATLGAVVLPTFEADKLLEQPFVLPEEIAAWEQELRLESTPEISDEDTSTLSRYINERDDKQLQLLLDKRPLLEFALKRLSIEVLFKHINEGDDKSIQSLLSLVPSLKINLRRLSLPKISRLLAFAIFTPLDSLADFLFENFPGALMDAITLHPVRPDQIQYWHTRFPQQLLQAANTLHQRDTFGFAIAMLRDVLIEESSYFTVVPKKNKKFELLSMLYKKSLAEAEIKDPLHFRPLKIITAYLLDCAEQKAVETASYFLTLLSFPVNYQLSLMQTVTMVMNSKEISTPVSVRLRLAPHLKDMSIQILMTRFTYLGNLSSFLGIIQGWNDFLKEAGFSQTQIMDKTQLTQAIQQLVHSAPAPSLKNTLKHRGDFLYQFMRYRMSTIYFYFKKELLKHFINIPFHRLTSSLLIELLTPVLKTVAEDINSNMFRQDNHFNEILHAVQKKIKGASPYLVEAQLEKHMDAMMDALLAQLSINFNKKLELDEERQEQLSQLLQLQFFKLQGQEDEFDIAEEYIKTLKDFFEPLLLADELASQALLDTYDDPVTREIFQRKYEERSKNILRPLSDYKVNFSRVKRQLLYPVPNLPEKIKLNPSAIQDNRSSKIRLSTPTSEPSSSPSFMLGTRGS